MHCWKIQALTVPHQRMGFFHGSNGALLVLSFYGIVHDRHVSAPCDGWGVGRAVRRVREDGTLAEGTWFLMYNEAAGYTGGQHAGICTLPEERGPIAH